MDTQQNDITKWNTNELLNQVSYSGPRAGVSLNTSFIDLHYKNNGQAPLRDRTRIRSRLAFSGNVTPTTSALLGFLITDNKYDTNKQLDSFAYGAFTGFSLAPTRQLSGEFNIGYTWQNFDRAPLDQPPPSGLSAGGTQKKSLYMQGNLHWNPTPRLSFDSSPFAIFRSPLFLIPPRLFKQASALMEIIRSRIALPWKHILPT